MFLWLLLAAKGYPLRASVDFMVTREPCHFPNKFYFYSVKEITMGLSILLYLFLKKHVNF